MATLYKMSFTLGWVGRWLRTLAYKGTPVHLRAMHYVERHCVKSMSSAPHFPLHQYVMILRMSLRQSSLHIIPNEYTSAQHNITRDCLPSIQKVCSQVRLGHFEWIDVCSQDGWRGTCSRKYPVKEKNWPEWVLMQRMHISCRYFYS